ALQEHTVIRRYDAPRNAPHFAIRMQRRYPSLPVIHTHLDMRIQEQAQTLAYNYIQRLRGIGIFNSAVFVVNNTTNAVTAYIGSQDFNDRDHAGQVDGVQAVRSPGSTLKPLVYAMGFEKGLVTPKSRLYDVPISIDGYAPENFDQTFAGAVSVEDALARSLNIPAVSLLNTMGVQPFAAKLSKCGFREISPSAKNVGLSLALGGCGVRLEELAMMYSCFARQGTVAPFRWIHGDSSSSVKRILSPASTFMITDILTKLTRPDIPTTFLNTMRVPRIAWKTGTSYGRRDAWSIGYNTKYTVAVWVGNFNGEGIPMLTGSTSATPLLFDIFSAIDNTIQTDWYSPPKDVDFRIVCSESGQPPGEDCDNTVTDYFIPTVSNAQPCSHIKRVAISSDKLYSYCTSCLPQNGYIIQRYVQYPPELINYYNGERIALDLPPPHNPMCTRVFADAAPTIVSPLDETTYIINRNAAEPLMLTASTASDVHRVYWYLNDKLVGTYPPRERVFVKPVYGENKISCSDDKGRNSDIRITVEWE
ncbi:MAG: penicillin-binding protein 1C, partial [Candidatus Kapabacteria bacterium]|nr:penicillin-binding protein 1C [Candidatus Kapabacteria bacterium]